MGSRCKAAGLLIVLVTLAVLILYLTKNGGVDPDEKREGISASRGESSRSRHAEDGRNEARTAILRAREALRDDPRMKMIWEDGSMENTLAGELLLPFNATTLRRMLDDPEANEWEVSLLLMRAGAEKHPGFQDLLTRTDLTADPWMEMALCVYDYNLNGNREALEKISARHRPAHGEDGGGWADAAAMALAYVDEWDLAKVVLEAHPMSEEGAAEGISYDFWLTRRYLFPPGGDFPDDYERFMEELGRAQQENARH